MDQIEKGLRLKGLLEYRKDAPTNAITCDVLLDIGRHEDDVEALPHLEHPDRKVMAVDMGKLIVSRHELEIGGWHDQIGYQQVNRSLMRLTEFEGV